MKDSDGLHPIDLARAAGISTQTVRQYERLGVLPPANRTSSGHRRYDSRHHAALLTARILMEGFGWQSAVAVMTALHQNDLSRALAVVDTGHAELDRRRREIDEILSALRAVSVEREPAIERFARTRRSLRVGEAARRVGVRVSALRFWEDQGLLYPVRDQESGYRLYDHEQILRLQLTVLLRRANYSFPAIRAVLDELVAGRPSQALAAAEARLTDVSWASRKCAAATAALWRYLEDWCPSQLATPLENDDGG